MSVQPAADQTGDQTGDESGETTRRWQWPRMIASAPWVVLLVGVSVLAVLLVVAALAFRGPERPATWSAGPPMVLPVLPDATNSVDASDPAGPPSAAGPTGQLSATPSGSTTPVAPTSPVPSPSVTGASGTDPSRSPASTASAPAPAAPDTGVLTASYRLQSADADSIQAELVVRNGTGGPIEWQLDLAFSAEVTGLRASSGPGVSVSIKGGGRYLLSGSKPLAAGVTQTVQLRVSRTGGGDYPLGCVLNGSPCGTG